MGWSQITGTGRSSVPSNAMFAFGHIAAIEMCAFVDVWCFQHWQNTMFQSYKHILLGTWKDVN